MSKRKSETNAQAAMSTIKSARGFKKNRRRKVSLLYCSTSALNVPTCFLENSANIAPLDETSEKAAPPIEARCMEIYYWFAGMDINDNHPNILHTHVQSVLNKCLVWLKFILISLLPRIFFCRILSWCVSRNPGKRLIFSWFITDLFIDGTNSDFFF